VQPEAIVRGDPAPHRAVVADIVLVARRAEAGAVLSVHASKVTDTGVRRDGGIG
jgi:hypothetical protein